MAPEGFLHPWVLLQVRRWAPPNEQRLKKHPLLLQAQSTARRAGQQHERSPKDAFCALSSRAEAHLEENEGENEQGVHPSPLAEQGESSTGGTHAGGSCKKDVPHALRDVPEHGMELYQGLP